MKRACSVFLLALLVFWIGMVLVARSSAATPPGPSVRGWIHEGVVVRCDRINRPYYDPLSQQIHLPVSYCRVLAGTRMDWVTAYVTWNLAHELGHAAGFSAEDEADCYAASHVAAVARELRRTPAQTRYIVRAAQRGGFGYRVIPASCWRRS